MVCAEGNQEIALYATDMRKETSPLAPDDLIVARIRHDDQKTAERLAHEKALLIRRRSRREWHDMWLRELEQFRSQPALALIADRLGMVWYKHRAQLILYAETPAHPLKEFALEETLERHRLVSQEQGLLGWAVIHGGDSMGWVAARDTESDRAWYRLLAGLWPLDTAEFGVPITARDASVWAEDIVQMLEQGWTCDTNPAQGFLGISQKWWLVGGFVMAAGVLAMHLFLG